MHLIINVPLVYVTTNSFLNTYINNYAIYLYRFHNIILICLLIRFYYCIIIFLFCTNIHKIIGKYMIYDWSTILCSRCLTEYRKLSKVVLTYFTAQVTSDHWHL